MLNFKNPFWVAGQIDNKEFYINFTNRLSVIMNNTSENDEITLFINSQGGESHTSLGIYDLVNNSKRMVIGIVSGTAQSGASLILQACNKRLMTKNSSIMLHKSSIQLAGSVDNAEEALKNLKEVDNKFFAIYANKTGKKIEEIKTLAHKDTYFEPKQALEFGLIDEIM